MAARGWIEYKLLRQFRLLPVDDQHFLLLSVEALLRNAAQGISDRGQSAIECHWASAPVIHKEV